MADKASEAGAPPQTPLTDAELAELEAGLQEAAKSDEHLCPRDLLLEISPLISEVRRLRARVKTLERRRALPLRQGHAVTHVGPPPGMKPIKE